MADDGRNDFVPDRFFPDRQLSTAVSDPSCIKTLFFLYNSSGSHRRLCCIPFCHHGAAQQFPSCQCLFLYPWHLHVAEREVLQPDSDGISFADRCLCHGHCGSGDNLLLPPYKECTGTGQSLLIRQCRLRQDRPAKCLMRHCDCSCLAVFDCSVKQRHQFPGQ